MAEFRYRTPLLARFGYWRHQPVGHPLARLQARRRLQPIRAFGKPILYLSGYREELNTAGYELLVALRSDPSLTVLWWNGDFPGYTAIREMLEASDAMVAFAGPLWLSGTNTAV